MIWKLRTGLGLGAIILGMILNPARVTLGQELESPEKKSEMNTEQQGPSSQSPNSAGIHVSVKKHHWLAERLEDFGGDQKDLWTSPKNLRFSDTVWLLPVSGLAAGLFTTDAESSRHMTKDPTTISHYKSISTYGVAGLVGGAAAMWAFSYKNHDSHWRETGFLAGEAALNSLVVTETLKYSFRRERPYQGDGTGPFFQNGTSFPSEHAAAAWSIASVIAHEYPGPLTKILAYSVAGLVSYSRVRGQQHFSSDVFVGGLIGELSGYTVYKRHHDPELGGDEWESWSDHARKLFDEPTRSNMGSPYVPLDSWIYPAIERLMGLGLIDSGFLAHRPWTRWECARLIGEAGDKVADSDAEAGRIYDALRQEFQSELAPPEAGLQARLESIYTRVTEISGTPLGRGLESFDFGQTLINDYGRPYQEGTNAVSGFSFYATGGPWVGYVRGEYQYAPGGPPLTLSERTFFPTVSSLQSAGVPPATPFGATSRFQLIEAYTGLQLSNWLVSFGPQTLWSGPNEGGGVLLSTNSQAIPMFRISRTAPLRVPLLSKILGPAWIEFFVGQLGGQNFFRSPTAGIIGNYQTPLQNQPYIHGERISWKPTPNFEFGVTRTVILGGGDIPMTFGYLGRSLIDKGEHNAVKGTSADPGKQASELDWNYRLPLLRRWVSFYGDAFTWDQLSPIAYWDRSAISAGLYFSHLPMLAKLDFRVEGVYSDVPAGGAIGHGFYYSEGASPYLNGYTNSGNLIGSWIGRDGQGAQAWTNYWFTPRTRLQFNFRHEKVSQQFVPGGGTLTDIGVRCDYQVRPDLNVSAGVQDERWLFPVIQPGAQKNVAATLQIEFQPQKMFQHQHTAKSEERTATGDGGRP